MQLKDVRVAICSHFSGFQSSYALHVGWHERARLLERHQINFDFLVNKKCREGLYPHQKNCLINPPTADPFRVRTQAFYKLYKDVLKDYDVILTADLVYQRKGNFLAYNAAMNKVAPELKGWWCHWIHSSWTARNPNVGYPESLRYNLAPRSFLVYLNSFELPGLQQMYNAPPDKTYAVYNPKDIRSFHEMSPLVWRVSDILDFKNKDAIQIFPFCTTRMDAKGILGVIKVHAALKRAGKKVALVLANANSSKRRAEIANKKKYMESLGLKENEDYLWTCDINNDKPIPRKDVADIFKLSNLFVFASWRETVGNVFQEAKISGCLLVLNHALPCLQEMGGKDAIYIMTDHKTPGVRDGEPGDFQKVMYQNGTENSFFDEVAATVIKRLPDKSHQWSFSLDSIFEQQMCPLLIRAYRASKGEDYSDIAAVKYVGERALPQPFAAYGVNKQWGKDMTGAPLQPIPEGGVVCN